MKNPNPLSSWNDQIEELADEMEIPELALHPIEDASSCLAREGILTNSTR